MGEAKQGAFEQSILPIDRIPILLVVDCANRQ
jgi:hypothetical protein